MTPDAVTPYVLVVEDDKFVRMVAVDILSDLHIETYEAADADEALFALAAYPRIAVLFTDINMPGGMDGVELARQVHRLRPDVGIIMTSGKQRPPIAALPGHGTFLAKPYGAEQLAQAIQQKLAHTA